KGCLMPTDDEDRARLPDRASKEHLRKQAKRLAKAEGLKLGHAQRRLARDHGFPNWATMMRAIDERAAPPRSPLSQAAARGDAEAGTPIERERILFLIADGPKIADPVFREAVAAIQAGDAAGLAALLDAHPRLLRERAIEPDIGTRGYFTDPKLFWFIANNPT